jgi:hypothetical protein
MAGIITKMIWLARRLLIGGTFEEVTLESKFKFESLSGYNVAPGHGGGLVFSVNNPFECQDFEHLIGASARIDGKDYTIVGVERFAHAPPWIEGEVIGLLVSDPKR